MAQIIKVKCNGPKRDINDVNLDRLLQPDPVMRGGARSVRSDVPERLVLNCRHCTLGKVVITREMIEDYRRGSR